MDSIVDGGSSLPEIEQKSDSQVADFYTDRSVLITGGTGFLGKVLVEKLLRSVPRLRRIYLLIRAKKGQAAEERWRSIAKTELFDRVRSLDDTDLLSKVMPVNGDVTAANLGLSEDHLLMLRQNVTVVFHCAASVRFDDHIRSAVRMNIIGTRRILELASTIPGLVAFVHTSTAYCNCDRQCVNEVVYPSATPWRRLIEICEWMDDEMLEELTPRILGKFPNSYTFTKLVAETMITDEEQWRHLPVVIVRPSIVTGAWREPIPGWIDNYNGATGIVAMAAKGVLRSMWGELCSMQADLVPVDVVANVLIVSGWQLTSKTDTPAKVVHCTTGHLNPTNWRQVMTTLMHYYNNVMPMKDLYRMPGGVVTPRKWEHKLRMFFDHYIPFLVVDVLQRIRGKRPQMLRVYDKMTTVLETLQFFYSNQWNFETNAIVQMSDRMSETDRQRFCLDVKKIEWPAYFDVYYAGIRKYIFNESPDNLQAARKVRVRRHALWFFSMFAVFAAFVAIVSRLFF